MKKSTFLIFLSILLYSACSSNTEDQSGTSIETGNPVTAEDTLTFFFVNKLQERVSIDGEMIAVPSNYNPFQDKPILQQDIFNEQEWNVVRDSFNSVEDTLHLIFSNDTYSSKVTTLVYDLDSKKYNAVMDKEDIVLHEKKEYILNVTSICDSLGCINNDSLVKVYLAGTNYKYEGKPPAKFSLIAGEYTAIYTTPLQRSPEEIIVR